MPKHLPGRLDIIIDLVSFWPTQFHSVLISSFVLVAQQFIMVIHYHFPSLFISAFDTYFFSNRVVHCALFNTSITILSRIDDLFRTIVDTGFVGIIDIKHPRIFLSSSYCLFISFFDCLPFIDIFPDLSFFVHRRRERNMSGGH